MEIGEKERQIKALRLAREARWKANAKAPIPQSSATAALCQGALAVLEDMQHRKRGVRELRRDGRKQER